MYSSRTNGSAAVVASIRIRSPGTTRVECSTNTFANFETRGSAKKFLLLRNEYDQIISFLLGVYSRCNEFLISHHNPYETTPSKHQNWKINHRRGAYAHSAGGSGTCQSGSQSRLGRKRAHGCRIRRAKPHWQSAFTSRSSQTGFR